MKFRTGTIYLLSNWPIFMAGPLFISPFCVLSQTVKSIYFLAVRIIQLLNFQIVTGESESGEGARKMTRNIL